MNKLLAILLGMCALGAEVVLEVFAFAGAVVVAENDCPWAAKKGISTAWSGVL